MWTFSTQAKFIILEINLNESLTNDLYDGNNL